MNEIETQKFLSDIKSDISYSDFNQDIFDWVSGLRINKWISLDGLKMERKKFCRAIVYLIYLGEPLIFNEDLTMIKREEPINISKS